jgi:A/G-specific adenine glycosylase
MTSRRAARDAPVLNQEDLSSLRRALLGRYDRERRSLPWRGETDPYRVLVSEVMLQQTRVETVLSYYEPWLERFPDLEALAHADEDDVLKAWEGLGYYRRARNLQRAARIARERPNAALPSTYAELRTLPGVGEYTAGAVASIAFGEPVPAADGNVRRVLSRLFDVPDPKPKWLRDAAAGLVDPERPGDWNQALMELGATVCTPRAPRCGVCPVVGWCRALAAGTQEERPGSVGRPAVRRATFALAVLRDGDRVLLERRPDDGLLGGMWAFPEREVEATAAAGHGASDAPRHASGALATALGARPRGLPELLAAYEHRFTHLHATYLAYLIEVDGSRVRAEGVRWVAPGTETGLALPVTQQRILDDVGKRVVPRRSEAGVS